MSRIYLDTNVYSNLRTQASPLYVELLKLLETYEENLSFVFSPAHIADKKKDLTDHKFKDFEFIESFTGDNHLSYHAKKKQTSFYLATPLMVFEDEEKNKNDLNDILSEFRANLNPDGVFESMSSLFKSIMQRPLSLQTNIPDTLTIEQQRVLDKIIPLDNPNATLLDVAEKQIDLYHGLMSDNTLYKDLRKVVDEGINNGKHSLSAADGVDFNELLRDSALQKSFLEFVEEATHTNLQGEKEYYDFYSQAYMSIDLLGLKKDKVTPKNSFQNMLNDGLHSYYGRYVDIFVTGDENLRLKTKTLYTLLGCKTRVMSVEEFVKELPLIGRSSDPTMLEFFEKLSRDIRELPRADTISEESGRKQSVLFTNNTYLNFFDCMNEIKEDGFTHYFLRKLPIHSLSGPNFREQAAILERVFTILEIDAQGKGLFDFERELRNKSSDYSVERIWRIGTLVISLKWHTGLKEFCMVISPFESIVEAASESGQ